MFQELSDKTTTGVIYDSGGSEGKRNRSFNLREEQLKFLEKQAENSGISVNAYLRRILDQYIGDLYHESKPPRGIRRYRDEIRELEDGLLYYEGSSGVFIVEMRAWVSRGGKEVQIHTAVFENFGEAQRRDLVMSFWDSVPLSGHNPSDLFEKEIERKTRERLKRGGYS